MASPPPPLAPPRGEAASAPSLITLHATRERELARAAALLFEDAVRPQGCAPQTYHVARGSCASHGGADCWQVRDATVTRTRVAGATAVRFEGCRRGTLNLYLYASALLVGALWCFQRGRENDGRIFFRDEGAREKRWR